MHSWVELFVKLRFTSWMQRHRWRVSSSLYRWKCMMDYGKIFVCERDFAFVLLNCLRANLSLLISSTPQIILSIISVSSFEPQHFTAVLCLFCSVLKPFIKQHDTAVFSSTIQKKCLKRKKMSHHDNSL